MSNRRDTDKIDAPPEGAKILHGFKATEELVQHFYKFGQWYHRSAYVLPDDLPFIRRHASVYEAHRYLYRCDYVLGNGKMTDLFVIPEYICVYDEKVSIVLLYTGKLRIQDW